MTSPFETRGPDFLVVGAHRAGTTWLHHVLRRHPDVWLPPIKELHYFDRPKVQRTWYEKKRWRSALVSGATTMDPWFLNYLFGKRSDRWYAGLFRRAQARGRLAGEITPAYATVDRDALQRMHQLNPGLRLIFIMRDPVARAWSAVNNAASKGYLGGELTVKAALERARTTSFLARSAYTETIERLESVFSDSRLHFCFFDHLKEEPRRFVAEILSFLNLNADNAEALLPPGAINSAAGSKPIPARFQRTIALESLPMVEQLCERFEGPPHKWRRQYRELLSVDETA